MELILSRNVFFLCLKTLAVKKGQPARKPDVNEHAAARCLTLWHTDCLNTCILVSKKREEISIIVQLIRWKKGFKKKKNLCIPALSIALIKENSFK